MLLQKEHGCLLVVDMQEKLAPLVQNPDKIEKNCIWLMNLAATLNVPVLVSEQYPRGLGRTLPTIQACMLELTDIEKIAFSCYRDSSFLRHWRELNRKQVVLVGIETHVCILQTALDMNAAGIDVFVVKDAVSSREIFDHEVALARLQQAGVHILTREMVLFEWLEQAGTTLFKSISQKFLK